MEITSNKELSGQSPKPPATVAGKVSPAVSTEESSGALKAAPSVPEFEKIDLDKAIAELQDFVDGLGRSLSFRQDDSIDRSVITVLDTQTEKVVRQIPSEEVIAIARQIRDDMEEARSGLLLNGNV